MSLSQPTLTASIAAPTPKLKLDQSANNTLNSKYFTIMCWAYGTSSSEAYQDAISVRDSTVGSGDSDDKIIGLALHETAADSGFYFINVGDADSDFDSSFQLPSTGWRHLTMVAEPAPDDGGTPAQRARVIGYMDGVQRVISDDSSLIPPVFPDNDCWVQLFNSRSSETDTGSVWVGEMVALKIWNNAALTGDEIFEEMKYFMPVRWKDIWCINCMYAEEMSQLNFVGLADFTVQGADFTSGRRLPGGLIWEKPQRTNAWAQAAKFLLNRP